MRTSGVVVVIIIDMAGGRFAQSPHLVAPSAYRILDFMFATFATSPSSRLRQHFMLITRLIRSVCLASHRLASPCLELPPVPPAKCEVETLHRRRQRLIQLPFALLAFNLEMGEL